MQGAVRRVLCTTLQLVPSDILLSKCNTHRDVTRVPGYVAVLLARYRVFSATISIYIFVFTYVMFYVNAIDALLRPVL